MNTNCYIVTYRSGEEQPLVDACLARIAHVDPSAHAESVCVNGETTFSTMMKAVGRFGELAGQSGLTYSSGVLVVLHPCVSVGTGCTSSYDSVSYLHGIDLETPLEVKASAVHGTNCMYTMNGTAAYILSRPDVLGAFERKVLDEHVSVKGLMQVLIDAAMERIESLSPEKELWHARGAARIANLNMQPADLSLTRKSQSISVNLGTRAVVDALRKSKLDFHRNMARLMETIGHEPEKVKYHE